MTKEDCRGCPYKDAKKCEIFTKLNLTYCTGGVRFENGLKVRGKGVDR